MEVQGRENNSATSAKQETRRKRGRGLREVRGRESGRAAQRAFLSSRSARSSHRAARPSHRSAPGGDNMIRTKERRAPSRGTALDRQRTRSRAGRAALHNGERERPALLLRAPLSASSSDPLHSTHGPVLITLGIHRKSRISLRDFAISKRTLSYAFLSLQPSPSAVCIALEIPVQSRPFPFDARDPTPRLLRNT